MPTPFRLTTLGAINLRDREDRPVREVLAQPKRVALLAYLALESRRGPVPRDRLLGLFWPDSEEGRARNGLSQALHQLRQALGAEAIESIGSGLAVNPGHLACDALAFLDAVERGDPAAALARYAGEFCPGLFANSPEVERWLDAERQRLRTLALEAGHRHLRAARQAGDPTALAEAARRTLALQPDDEADLRDCLTALDAAGDPAAALLAYDDFARRLAATLELEPAPETRELAESIRRRRLARGPVEPLALPTPVPPRSAPPVPPAPLPPPRPRWRPLVAGALLLLVAAGIAAFTLVGAFWRPRDQAVRTVAVFPFAVRGDSALGYLHEGMMDLLAAKLGGSAGLHVIDPRSIVAALAGRGAALPAADAEKLSRSLGAGWYLTGDVTAVGGRVQFSAALHDLASGADPVATGSVVGDTTALFELVDDLAGRMLAGLTRGRDTTITRLAATTTHSLPALKAFLEGERAFRAGRDVEAGAAFRTAAELDTGFALAEYRLAMAGTWVSVPDMVDPALWADRAARHAARLTPLARDLLEAYSAYKGIRAREAEGRYRAITEAYPDNVEAWFMLGEARFHYGPYAGESPLAAWPAFARVLALEPANLHALLHLIRIAAADARLTTLDSLAARAAELTPDATRLIEVRALQAFAHRDPARRAGVLAEARGTDGLVLWSLAQGATNVAPDAAAARALAPALLATITYPYLATYARRTLSVVDLMAGRLGTDSLHAWLRDGLDEDWWRESEALLVAEPLLPVPRAELVALRRAIAARQPYPVLGRSVGPPPPPALGPVMQRYLLGLLDLRLGDSASARRAADELVATTDSLRKEAATQFGHALRGELARGRGDLRTALAEYARFDGTVRPTLGFSLLHWGQRERFARAEILRALGRSDEALAVYESFLQPLDTPFVPLSSLRRGQLHAARGDTTRAIAHLERFVAAWQHADPALLPLAAEAQALLDSLHRRP